MYLYNSLYENRLLLKYLIIKHILFAPRSVTNTLILHRPFEVFAESLTTNFHRRFVHCLTLKQNRWLKRKSFWNYFFSNKNTQLYLTNTINILYLVRIARNVFWNNLLKYTYKYYITLLNCNMSILLLWKL